MPAGTTLTVDGRGLEATESSKGQNIYVTGTGEGPGQTPSGSFVLLLDPGRHIFVLARPGVPDRVVTELFKPGETRSLTLSAESASAPAQPTAVSAPRAGRDYTWPIIAYGVGAAGLTIGSMFGIATFNKEADLEEHCGPNKDACPAGEKDMADRYAMISNIAFGVGLAGVGVGTFLLFSAKSEEGGKPRPQAALRAWVLPTSVGLRGSF
jgi:hypothetical protein